MYTIFSFYFVWLSSYKKWLLKKKRRAAKVYLLSFLLLTILFIFMPWLINKDVYLFIIFLLTGVMIVGAPFVWTTFWQGHLASLKWHDDWMKGRWWNDK